MRVTTQQTYVSMTQSFNNLSGSLAHVVEQMATGKEILQPSDDPIAATRITQLNRQQSAIEQYQSNIDSASAGLKPAGIDSRWRQQQPAGGTRRPA